MGNSGTSSHISSPVILVVNPLAEMERMIRQGFLSCPTQLEFCHGVQNQVMHHIEVDQPGLLIAPLMLDDVNAADLQLSIIQRTGAPLPSIFIADPKYIEIQKKLLRLGAFDFVPPDYQMEDLLNRVERVVRLKPQKTESRLEAFLTPPKKPA